VRPRRRFEQSRPQQDTTRINESIRVPRVRLVDSDGSQVGIKPTAEALEYAYSKDLDLVEVAAKAGFQALEPWMFELEMHKSAAPLKDLGKKIADLGMTVESAIGFAPWIVDDDTKRAKGVEQMKREMDMVLQIGGKRIAVAIDEEDHAHGAEEMERRRGRPHAALWVFDVTELTDIKPVSMYEVSELDSPWARATPGRVWSWLGVRTNGVCGLTADGEAWCWGSNMSGELGDGTTEDSLVPKRVGAKG